MAMRKYEVKIYEADVLIYESIVETDDIHDDIWDMISDAIWAAYPTDNMSEPHDVTIQKAYDDAEFDETGFTAYFGVDDACMITATMA
jgi:hypothetical protein